MGSFVDLTGRCFGRLTVIERAADYVSPRGYHSTAWKCQCECGKTVTVRAIYLKNGRTKSCGCNRVNFPNRLTHGESKKAKLYRVWKSMNARCSDTNDSNYGGRGISVCAEWRDSYISFRDWALSNGYSSGLSIDRIDVNGNYEPSNCRWADIFTQANNTRVNHIIEYEGRTLTMAQWAREKGIKYQKLKDRISKCGWDIEAALTTP